MRIALAQINTTVGDFEGNLAKVLDAYRRAVSEGVELAVFPEQTLLGYPAEDLLERQDFLRRGEEALGRVVEASRGASTAIVIGAATRAESTSGKPLYNSAVAIQDGRVLWRQHKTLLPAYDVFDEGRYFQPASDYTVLPVHGRRLGIAVCEDIWNDPSFWPRRRYPVDPVERLRELGADVLVVISASPFSIGRRVFRYHLLESILRRWSVPAVFVNLVGGNTSLIFDGNSFAMDSRAQLIAKCRAFEEDFQVAELGDGRTLVKEAVDECAEAHAALVLGTRDYVQKCGFERVVLGLSGGIDSSLTAAIAAAAIGRENVIGVSMPSRFSSEGSRTDARFLAERLGVSCHEVPIEDLVGAALRTLEPLFRGLPEDVTEENLQARARGLLLMAISNKLGALLLTTGNKSELAVGYCTLYGDMCGGLAVISDVPKTLVYRLARYVNRSGEIIPKAVFDKAPSAELRPGQTDQETLPSYEILDRIIEAYVEHGAAPAAIAAQQIPRRLVDEIVARIDRSEFKRKQAAPGLRITAKAFGPGRRYPIVQRYREPPGPEAADGGAPR